MIHSGSQRPTLWGKTLCPASHVASSRLQRPLLKPGSAPSPPEAFSHASCFGFSPLSSAASRNHLLRQGPLVIASLKPPSGKGFGKKNAVAKKTKPSESSEATSGSSAQEEVPSKSQYKIEEEDVDDVVPEVVTNRMLQRIGITVGVPLAVGVLIFPLFYYLKIVNRVDVPEWLPLLVSMVTFGTAGLGISYGVISSSWDPAREGSLLGWKEAQVNWPLIWNKFQGSEKKK